MSTTAIVLVLGSALLHAAWNARTHAGDGRRATLTVAYLTVTVGVMLASAYGLVAAGSILVAW